jgi:putative hydrolase of the HAD superfamily
MRGDERRGFDAVICDVDGVVRLWQPDSMTRWDLAYGLPEGTLAGAAFAEHRLRPVITGLVTDEQWRAQVATDLRDACGSLERAQELVAAWRARNGLVDSEVVALLVRARRHVRVVALSNATTCLEEQLTELGVDNVFHAIVNTAREGVCKPDPRIYRIAARRAGAEPSRCLSPTTPNETSKPRASSGCLLSTIADIAIWKTLSRLYSLQRCNSSNYL